jgi:hypothetical protein
VSVSRRASGNVNRESRGFGRESKSKLIKVSPYSYGKNQTQPIFAERYGQDLDRSASRDLAVGRNSYMSSNVDRSVMIGDVESDYKEKNYATAAGKDDGKPKDANLNARSGIGHNRAPH